MLLQDMLNSFYVSFIFIVVAIKMKKIFIICIESVYEIAMNAKRKGCSDNNDDDSDNKADKMKLLNWICLHIL